MPGNPNYIEHNDINVYDDIGPAPYPQRLFIQNGNVIARDLLTSKMYLEEAIKFLSENNIDFNMNTYHRLRNSPFMYEFQRIVGMNVTINNIANLLKNMNNRDLNNHGTKRKSKKRTSMKYRPKRKSSCKKRNMIWNQDTKRCNKNKK